MLKGYSNIIESLTSPQKKAAIQIELFQLCKKVDPDSRFANKGSTPITHIRHRNTMNIYIYTHQWITRQNSYYYISKIEFMTQHSVLTSFHSTMCDQLSSLASISYVATIKIIHYVLSQHCIDN